MNLVNGLDSPQVVYSWVDTNLVEADQTSVLELLVESLHLRVDIRGGNNVSLFGESSLHDTCVVGVWDEGDNDVVSLDGLSKGVSRSDIDRHGCRVGEVGTKLLGSSESSASDRKLVVVPGNVVGGRTGDETGAKEEDLLLGGLSSGGRVGGELGEFVDTIVQHGPTEFGKGKESSFVDVGVVVSGIGDGSKRDRDVSTGLLGADHDTDLTTRVYDQLIALFRFFNSQVGMVVKAYSATGKVFLQVSLSSLIKGKCIQIHSAWVEMCPPAFRDSLRRVK